MVAPLSSVRPALVSKPFDDHRFNVKLRPGQRLHADSLELETLEFLGSGGNGSVFRMLITDGELRGLIVATKFLEVIRDPERVERFAKEIKILKEVNHPHVIKVLDTGTWKVGDHHTVPFFVMEYQPRNLERETSAHPRGLHPDAVLPLCLQMTSAMVHIHSKDIVHRDLKPANILYDGSNVKLADFGIASLLDRGAVVKSSKGKKVGPYYYLSPEQWKWWKEETKDIPGKESDIFQLGLIFLKMLTGFNANTVHDWEKGGINEEPKSRIRVYDGSLVNDIANIVREMDRGRSRETPNRRTGANPFTWGVPRIFLSFFSTLWSPAGERILKVTNFMLSAKLFA